MELYKDFSSFLFTFGKSGTVYQGPEPYSDFSSFLFIFVNLFLSKDFNTNHEEARKKGPLIAQIAAPIATIYRIKNWQSEMANNCKIKDWAE